MKKNKSFIEYSRWEKIIFQAEYVVAISILITEIIGNITLYLTRSQGYGPDTIVLKLLRYLLMPTIINFGVIFISKALCKKHQEDSRQKYILIVGLVIIFTNVCWSHYQFAGSFAAFCVPIIISILYEDKKFLHVTMIISVAGSMVGIASRAMDPYYNEDLLLNAIVPLAIVIAVYKLSGLIITTLRERREQLETVMEKAQKVEIAETQTRMSFQMLETLAKAIDAKDRYTNGHSIRVAQYSARIAEALGWNREEINAIRYEALLHDIGKIGIPDSVLNKPGRLTDLEFNLIQSHTTIGAEILRDMASVPQASTVARNHHEKYNGKGYPDGLAGDSIPVNARIICIADSYDAMNSDRIYRKALSREVILEELRKGRGTQFDPDYLDVFIELLEHDDLVPSTEISVNDETAVIQNTIGTDIENVLSRMNHQEEQKDFAVFYEYMDNIGKRYNRTVEIISMELSSISGEEIDSEEMYNVSRFVEIASRKNIRSVDVYSRYSDTRHVIILLGAGVENIDMIAQRIFYDFYQLADSKKYKLKYELVAKGGSYSNLSEEEMAVSLKPSVEN